MPVAPPAGASRFWPAVPCRRIRRRRRRRRGIRHTLAKRCAESILVRKGKIQAPRPAGMSRQNAGLQAAAAQLLLQRCQRTDGKLVVLRQRGKKAVAPACAQPNRVTREQIAVIEQINQMSPGMARHQHGLHLTDVALRAAQRPIAVRLHGPNVVCILMRDQNVPNLFRTQPQPAHLFLQPFIVISGVDHNRRRAIAAEEDVGDPFPHARHMLIDPAGVQRLENLLAAIHPAHFPPLKFRCLLAHALFPRFWLRQFKATPPRLPHGQSSLLFHTFRAALQVHFWKFIYIFQKSAVRALAKPFFIRYNRAYALCVKKYEGRSGNSYAA